jgi:hypothetical protein
MTLPVRLRLSRARGFNLQAHSREVNGLPAIVVARPGFWGNPFVSSEKGLAARTFRVWLTGSMRSSNMLGLRPIRSNLRGLRRVMCEAVPNLRSRNLACWCRLDQPCHADVLLELANR